MKRFSNHAWIRPLTLSLINLVASGACLLAQSRESDWELVRRSQPVLGTFAVITAYGTNQAALQSAVSAAFDEFHRLDAILSLHRPDSELNGLNARAFENWITVSPELFEVISIAQQIARDSEGAFDITTRPLTELWGFLWREYRMPTDEELAKVLPQVDWRQIELDPNTRRIRYGRPDTSIDLGGIGKGFIVDQALAKLGALGVTNALIRAGGDVRVSGPPPGREAWPIQIEDPAKQGRRLAVPLVRAAISTSGNYENFFVVDGQRYSHVLNPRTGLPVQGVASCTVIAPTCAQSDAWATAAFILGPEKSLAALSDRFGLFFVLPAPEPTAESRWIYESNNRFPPTNSDL